MDLVTSTFSDPDFNKLVQDKIPKLFQQARIEAEIYNISMAVGFHRKKKIIDLLKYFIGSTKVNVVSSKMSETDIIIDNHNINIKTISNNNLLKITWTMDSKKVALLIKEYIPLHDILLAKINWEMKDVYQPSGLFFIPIETQINILQTVGIKNYLKPPNEGTNARGVQLTKQAYNKLLTNNNTIHIEVDWKNI